MLFEAYQYRQHLHCQVIMDFLCYVSHYRCQCSCLKHKKIAIPSASLLASRAASQLNERMKQAWKKKFSYYSSQQGELTV